eukprot:6198065-Pleurochrysis_carterae.AAC.2
MINTFEAACGGQLRRRPDRVQSMSMAAAGAMPPLRSQPQQLPQHLPQLQQLQLQDLQQLPSTPQFPPVCEVPSAAPARLTSPQCARASPQANGQHVGFPKQFWLGPRTVLTQNTPISALNRFCVEHGFYLWELGGSTPLGQRIALYSMLERQGWPDGYEAYMKAVKGPRAPRPGGDLTMVAAQRSTHDLHSSQARLSGSQSSRRPKELTQSQTVFQLASQRSILTGSQLEQHRWKPEPMQAFLPVASKSPASARAAEQARRPLDERDLSNESVEQLMHILEQQTSVTQMWQELLLEQSGTEALFSESSKNTRPRSKVPRASPLVHTVGNSALSQTRAQVQI